jgi:hypothetical protein
VPVAAVLLRELAGERPHGLAGHLAGWSRTAGQSCARNAAR